MESLTSMTKLGSIQALFNFFPGPNVRFSCMQWPKLGLHAKNRVQVEPRPTLYCWGGRAIRKSKVQIVSKPQKFGIFTIWRGSKSVNLE